MSDSKLQDLTELTTPSATDLLFIEDGSGSSFTPKKVTITNLFASPEPIGATTANTGVFTSLNVSGLTASELTATDANKALQSLAVATYPSLTEIAYVKGVTSAIQTQLNAKAAALSGTINEIAYFNSSTTIASLAVATYPSLTELSYVKGITSAIQTQLDGKQASGSYQTQDAVLDDLSALTAVSGADQLIVSTGAGAYAHEAASTLPATIGGVIQDLDTLGAAASDGQFIVATGAGAFAYESGATVRNSLGLGNVENTALSTWAGTTNLTTAGVLSVTSIGGITQANLLDKSVGETITGAWIFDGVDFRIAGNTDSCLFFVDASTDRVGIGTQTPAQRLQIFGANTTDNANIQAINFRDNDTASAANQIIGRIEFEGRDTASPGVGTYIQAVAEDVSGNQYFVIATGAGGSATERMRIASDGGIYAYNLLNQSAAGLVVEWDSTTKELYAETSAARFKKDITEIDFNTSKIFDLEAKSYIDKETGRKEFGLIAEDVYAKIPELAIAPEGNPIGVKYMKLSVLLLKELQSLKQEILSLKQ